MKDNQLRRDMEETFKYSAKRRDDLESRVRELENMLLTVKPCKKCRHDTLHQFHPRLSHFGSGRYVGTSIQVEGDTFQAEDYHRCLTCGNAWVYHNEEMAEEYFPQNHAPDAYRTCPYVPKISCPASNSCEDCKHNPEKGGATDGSP